MVWHIGESRSNECGLLTKFPQQSEELNIQNRINTSLSRKPLFHLSTTLSNPWPLFYTHSNRRFTYVAAAMMVFRVTPTGSLPTEVFLSKVAKKLAVSVAASRPEQFANTDLLKTPRGIVPASLLVGQEGESDIQQLNHIFTGERVTAVRLRETWRVLFHLMNHVVLSHKTTNRHLIPLSVTSDIRFEETEGT